MSTYMTKPNGVRRGPRHDEKAPDSYLLLEHVPSLESEKCVMAFEDGIGVGEGYASNCFRRRYHIYSCSYAHIGE